MFTVAALSAAMEGEKRSVSCKEVKIDIYNCIRNNILNKIQLKFIL